MTEGTIRIVYVEDDDRLARLTTQYLSSHGVEVTLVTRGDRAVAEVVRVQPDAWRRTERISDPTLTRVGVFTAPGASRGRMSVDASTLANFRAGWQELAVGRSRARNEDPVEAHG